jgi:hypothetical protein
MDAKRVHVSCDRELPSRLAVLVDFETIGTGVLPLLKSQVPNLHMTSFRID